MNEHVTAWLGAYHDGELHGRRLRQVEAHLAICGTCCADLDRLRALTALLAESPPPADLTPPERFVAQVGLRLARPPERPAWHRALEIGWGLMPLGLLSAWAIIQAVLLVAGVALWVLELGVGGDLLAGLLPARPAGPAFAETFRLSGANLGDVGRVAVVWLRGGGTLGWGAALELASLVTIGLLYWSWLASWWAGRQRRMLRR